MSIRVLPFRFSILSHRIIVLFRRIRIKFRFAILIMQTHRSMFNRFSCLRPISVSLTQICNKSRPDSIKPMSQLHDLFKIEFIFLFVTDTPIFLHMFEIINQVFCNPLFVLVGHFTTKINRVNFFWI
jgi:hypothetical protein